MTWIDIAAIVIVVIFMAVGARLGSLWSGACLIGGFIGAFLSDLYALPFSELIGGFSGSEWVAMILLYVLGALIALVPGWILSRLSSALFLGVIDSAAGLVSGGLVGLLVIFLLVIFVIPSVPKFEKNKAWKKSAVVRPIRDSIEDLFYKRKFKRPKISKKAKKKAIKKIKKISGDLIEKIPD